MRISYVKGNLFEGVPVIVHGCNAQGRMGRGVALGVRENFQWAYDVYVNEHKHHGLKLGSVVWAIQTLQESGPKIIGNAITQEYWQAIQADAEGRLVDYDAMRSCFQEVERFARLTQGSDPALQIAAFGAIKEVGFPMIGSALGGGDWAIISQMLEEESKDTFLPVVYQL